VSPASEARRFTKPFRIRDGAGFRLKHFEPDDTRGLKSKEEAQVALRQGVERLARLQEKLYAQDRWGALIIFQGMDAAGKDGAVKHVMSGVNPQGVQVYSFKAPSAEELDHDYLWRTSRCLPERGRIGIFNRSYYEEVLVTRVHPEILGRQRLPPERRTKDIWKERFEDIKAFERYLWRNGFIVLKFFLHLSAGEQRRRLLERLDDPAKNWKFSIADAQERGFWRDYTAAYEDMIRNTATRRAPWYVVPANNKWFTRVVVAEALVEALNGLNLAFPALDAAKRSELRQARAILEGGKRRKARRAPPRRARLGDR
jgi:PPK2 family polyphosphate:nucleotide phosphotransferase